MGTSLVNRPETGKGKVKANIVGAIGAALAMMVIKDAKGDAEREAKKSEGLKPRLIRIRDFPTREDHLKFRFDLEAALEEQKKIAEAQEVTWTTFREGNTFAAVLGVMVSLWKKMSSAVETGWKPTDEEIANTPWGTLSVMATERLAAKGSTGKAGAPKTAGPTARKTGRKGKAVKEQVQQMMQATGLAIPLGSKEPPPNRNLAEVVGTIISGATLAELAQVVLVVEAEMTLAKAREEAAAKAKEAIATAKRDEKKGVSGGSMGTKEAKAITANEINPMHVRKSRKGNAVADEHAGV